MRLFIAVNPGSEIKDKIMKLQEQLRSQSARGSFSRPENFHITLAFLGETPEGRAGVICNLMEKIQAAPFDVVFNRTGCFTHSRKELWWIGPDQKSPGLSGLVSIHDQLLGLLLEAGFAADTRPFRAHITLGREIRPLRLSGSSSALAKPIILDCPDITIPVNRIRLMKSEHIGSVLTYTELFSVEMKNTSAPSPQGNFP